MTRFIGSNDDKPAGDRTNAVTTNGGTNDLGKAIPGAGHRRSAANAAADLGVVEITAYRHD